MPNVMTVLVAKPLAPGCILCSLLSKCYALSPPPLAQKDIVFPLS